MPIYAIWDDPQHTILRLECRGRWTWKELDAAWEVLRSAVATNPPYLDFIFDVTNSTLMPPDIGYRLRNGQYTIGRADSMRVIVGADKFFQLMIEFITRVFSNNQVRFADDLEEARRLIAEVRRVRA